MSTLGALSLFTLLALAQETLAPANHAPHSKKTTVPGKTAEEKQADARKKLALDLLKQSHALNDQLDYGNKVGPMREQVKYAMLVDKELGKQWSHELFDLASKSQSDFELKAQMDAIEDLSRAYPEDALALLEQIDPRISHQIHENSSDRISISRRLSGKSIGG
jgi:hypothetical protein